MTVTLYDLAAADDDIRFSPYCWRIKMALAHKGLEVRTVPWRFSQKESIAFSGSTTVPVIIDQETVVSDSWAIAVHLDEAYRERPLLFDSPQARGYAYALKCWAEQCLHPIIRVIVLKEVYSLIHPEDREHFRQSRERQFQRPLETVFREGDRAREQLSPVLAPLESTLRHQPYLAGSSPGFADYIVFGVFQWIRSVSEFHPVQDMRALQEWRERLLDLHGGLARKARAIGP